MKVRYLTFSSHTQTLPATATPQIAETPTSDQAFYDEAAISSLFDLMTSELALQRSEDPQVRQFAQTLLHNQDAANARLKALAQRKNVSLPVTLDEERHRLLSELTQTPGPHFDDSYLSQMEAGQHAAQKQFKEAILKAADPDVRRFAGSVLSSLWHHTDLLKRLERRDIAA